MQGYDEDGFVGDITIGYAAVINGEQKSYFGVGKECTFRFVSE
jgi:hypothetical protein